MPSLKYFSVNEGRYQLDECISQNEARDVTWESSAKTLNEAMVVNEVYQEKGI